MKTLGTYQKWEVYEDVTELKMMLLKNLAVRSKRELFEKVRLAVKEKFHELKVIFSTEFPNGKTCTTGDTFTAKDLASLEAFEQKLHRAKTSYKSRLGNVSLCLAEMAYDGGLIELMYPVMRSDWEERSMGRTLIYTIDYLRVIDYYAHHEILRIILDELEY